MRDPELLLKLLRQMANDPAGRIIVYPKLMDTSSETLRVLHHVDLLVDANHAMREPDGNIYVRITNDGYDFLQAIDADPKYLKNFLDMLVNGATYINAATTIVRAVSVVAAPAIE